MYYVCFRQGLKGAEDLSIMCLPPVLAPSMKGYTNVCTKDFMAQCGAERALIAVVVTSIYHRR